MGSRCRLGRLTLVALLNLWTRLRYGPLSTETPAFSNRRFAVQLGREWIVRNLFGRSSEDFSVGSAITPGPNSPKFLVRLET